MEKHFLADLIEPLKVGDHEKLDSNHPRPWFNSHGDCVIYQTANEAVVADRVDELLTIYNSAIDNRPIGFQIKGVCGLLSASGADGLAISATICAGEIREVSLSLLLLMAYETHPATFARRQGYASALSQAASAVSLCAPCA
ncbi:MAG: hypothetical protein NTZ09_15345 [Candidatus Hydrogenedentes bacterium]|nr:hypothetical protein [Candidatus Hydrogenedentota bacterium]